MKLTGCSECGSDRVSHVLTPKRVSSQCLACGKVWSSEWELGARYFIRNAEWTMDRVTGPYGFQHLSRESTLRLELISFDGPESWEYTRRLFDRGMCRLVMIDD